MNPIMMFSQIREICKLCVFLLLFVIESEGYKPAPNCARYECPPYTVVHENSEFEIRSYKDALWVSSPNFTGNSYTDPSNKGFRILFSYYNGNNGPRVKINMTTPVLVDIDNNEYTVYFYVPSQYQDSFFFLPPPLDDKVKPVKLPRHKYAAVRRFGGFLSDKSIATEIESLRKSVNGTRYEAAASVVKVTAAGYNSPFEFINRVNEVMLWFD